MITPIPPPAFPRQGIEFSTGAVEYSETGMTLLDYFATRADLDMHRGPKGGLGTRVAILMMGEACPYQDFTMESLEWWAEAESRYRFLKAMAMLKAREWIA